jgi:Domain of unknown function (DUF3303)
MKYIVISKLAPGTENARKALEVYGKAGLPPGTEATWAGTDGKTFVNIVETDVPDIQAASTFAPFFEETTVIPVVPLDDAWMKAIQAAQSNWG